MYSKIGKEYAENHSDYINTCSVLPYGIKFVGIEAGDKEGDKHNEKAIFYMLFVIVIFLRRLRMLF